MLDTTQALKNNLVLAYAHAVDATILIWYCCAAYPQSAVLQHRAVDSIHHACRTIHTIQHPSCYFAYLARSAGHGAQHIVAYYIPFCYKYMIQICTPHS